MAKNLLPQSVSYWLVKTGQGAAEIQRFTAGQKPPGGQGKNNAIYLGSTPAEANKYAGKAARQLRVPNPHNVPSAATSAGIIGSILGGFGLGAAGELGAAGAGGAAATAGGEAAGAGSEAAGAGATAGATSTAAGGAAGGLFGTVAGAITDEATFLAFIAWIFHPRTILRAVEFLVGLAVMGFGAQAALQARGEGIEGFSTSEMALTRSGLGRVATQLGSYIRSNGDSQRQAPRRQSAPHTVRRDALRQRYAREQQVRRRQQHT